MARDPMWRRYLRFWGSNPRADLDTELRFHLDEQTERYIGQGMSREEARATAERRFGDSERTRRECLELDERERRSRVRFRALAEFVHDARVGLRVIGRQPAHALAVVLTLVLGIGANVTLFSVVHAVILRPLPYAEPDRLVALWETDLTGERGRSRATASDFGDWQQQNQVFESLAMFAAGGFDLTGDGVPEQVRGSRVTASYFDVLGVQPILGRPFRVDEETAGQHRVALLGHEFWLERYGGREEVVGQTVRFNDEPYQIVGVMPPGVYPMWPATRGRIPFNPRYQQFWVPLVLSPEQKSSRRGNVFGAIGRLAQGLTLAQAQSQMDGIAAWLRDEYPAAKRDEGIVVVPLMDEVVGDSRLTLWVLMGAVGIVLLVACTNVAGLILARTLGRQRELAVRASLGATGVRLVRQLTAEVVALALIGAVGGTVLAAVALEVVQVIVPADIPRLGEARIDGAVLLFTLAVAIVAGLASAAIPALRMLSGPTRRPLLSRASVDAGVGPSDGLRKVLVGCQIALAIVLMIGATLLGESYRNLVSVDPGFEPDRMLTVNLVLFPARYQGAQQVLAFQDELANRLRATPGVEGVTVAYDHPLTATWVEGFALRDFAGRPEDAQGSAWMRPVAENYFAVAGIDVVGGRRLESTDDLGRPGAVVVNEAFASRFFAGDDPVGTWLMVGSHWEWSTPTEVEIVGVVDDVKFLGVDKPSEPAYYRPVRQFPVRELTLLVRTAGDPLDSIDFVRSAVWEIDPDLPVGTVSTMSRRYADQVAQPRFMLQVQGVFAVAAVILALVGIYGLLSYQVAGRTREIGLRMALGAPARGVVGLFVRQGLALVTVGVLVGVLAGVAVTRFLRGVLFGVDPLDPVAFAAVALALAGVALLACWLPARRAARVDAMVALRAD